MDKRLKRTAMLAAWLAVTIKQVKPCLLKKYRVRSRFFSFFF